MKDRFPLKIVANDQRKSRFNAATSIDKLDEGSRNIRQELTYLEEDYSILIKTIREIIDASSQSKKVDPRLYWLVGDNIIRFLNRIDDMGFYLMQQNHTLARDIGISESSIEKILGFRKRFTRISMVDPTVSWTKYRANKVAVPDKMF